MGISDKRNKLYLSILIIAALSLNTGVLFAASQNQKTNDVIRAVINNPSQTNIYNFTKVMLKEYKKAYKENRLEDAADYLRSALYFLKQTPNSFDYQHSKIKLDNIVAKMGLDTSENSRLELAKSLYLENKLFASAYEFSTLLKEGYEADVCYEYLGDIAYAMKSTEDAFGFYKRGVEYNPENLSVKYKYAKMLLNKGKTNDAIYYLEEVIDGTNSSNIINEIVSDFTKRIENNPNDENNYGILGLAYQRLGDYNKTYQLLRKSLLINPNDVFLRYYLANLLFNIKEYSFADEIYTEILEENPYESQIRISRAKTYGITGQKEKAIKDYQIVLAMYPDSIQAQYGMFSLLKNDLPLEKIVNLFYPLEADYKLNNEGYNNLGYLANKFEKVNDAVIFFEKSLSLNPKSEIPYIELYKAYQLLGQNDKAKEIIQKGYKLFPKNEEVIELYSSLNSDKVAEKNKVALSYLNEGDYKKALAIYQQIEPKNAATYEAMGNCCRQLGDLNGAIENYRKSLEINSENSEAYYALGGAYLENKDEARAKKAFTKSIQKDAKNIKSKKMINYIEQKEIATSLDTAYDFYEKKDYKSALKYLDKAVETFPNDPKAYYYRGLVKEAMGDYKAAVSDLKETIKIDRNYIAAYYKLAENLDRIGKEKDALYMYEKYLGAENIDASYAKNAQQRVIELGEKYY